MSTVAPKLKATVMDADAIRRALSRMAHEIVERNRGVQDVVLVGIVSKGDVLARRLGVILMKMERCAVPTGSIDVTRHRDDLHLRAPSLDRPPSQVPSVDDKVVVLIDDVIWHGRTVRAAMDALLEFGRPRAVQLAVLVDRGHRELPIRPDYVGKNVPTAAQERIDVCLCEEEGIDAVVLLG